MNPAKMLIAQRLAEHAREGYALADLMCDYIKDPKWERIVSDVASAAETAEYWAEEIRVKES